MNTRLQGVRMASALTLAVALPAQAQLVTWDFDADEGSWTQEIVSGSQAWTWSPGFWSIGQSANIGLSRLLSPVLTATSGFGLLSILHRYNFEPDGGDCFDGGAVSYRVNGGAWTPLDFIIGDYSGTVSGAFGNPLAGREAWCGNSFATVLSGTGGLINPGDTYQLGFEAGWDNSIQTPAPNWRITRVDTWGFEQVSTVPEPSTMALLATGLVGLAWAGRRRRRPPV